MACPAPALRWQVISLASNKPVLSRIRPTPPDRSRPSFAFGVARRWSQVPVERGQSGVVPTKMGGPQAPRRPWTGVPRRRSGWRLALSDALVSGQYFYHKRILPAHPAASDIKFQNRLLDPGAELTGVELPSAVAP